MCTIQTIDVTPFKATMTFVFPFLLGQDSKIIPMITTAKRRQRFFTRERLRVVR